MAKKKQIIISFCFAAVISVAISTLTGQFIDRGSEIISDGCKPTPFPDCASTSLVKYGWPLIFKEVKTGSGDVAIDIIKYNYSNVALDSLFYFIPAFVITFLFLSLRNESRA
ncbi:MAG: hypothetical protein Q7S53_00890 [bacterium]|nr:hypothetical protein [bacterium]